MIKKGIYTHYKGNKYQVIGIASHSETLEKMVDYNQLISKTELDVCEEYCNKNFTLLETTNGLKRRYEINAVADLILDNYNEVEYKEL